MASRRGWISGESDVNNEDEDKNDREDEDIDKENKDDS